MNLNDNSFVGNKLNCLLKCGHS